MIIRNDQSVALPKPPPLGSKLASTILTMSPLLAHFGRCLLYHVLLRTQEVANASSVLCSEFSGINSADEISVAVAAGEKAMTCAYGV